MRQAATRHLLQLGGRPPAPAVEACERRFQPFAKAVQIALQPRQAGRFQLGHERPEHNLLEDPATTDLRSDLFAQALEGRLDLLEVRALEHRQQSAQSVLDTAYGIRLIQQLLEVSLGRWDVLVKAEQYRRGPDAGVRLYRESVADVRKPRRGLAQVVVVGLGAAPAAVLLWNDRGEEPLFPGPVDVAAGDVMQLLDVALERWVETRIDEALTKDPELVLVVRANGLIRPHPLRRVADLL